MCATRSDAPSTSASSACSQPREVSVNREAEVGEPETPRSEPTKAGALPIRRASQGNELSPRCQTLSRKGRLRCRAATRKSLGPIARKPDPRPRCGEHRRFVRGHRWFSLLRAARTDVGVRQRSDRTSESCGRTAFRVGKGHMRGSGSVGWRRSGASIGRGRATTGRRIAPGLVCRARPTTGFVGRGPAKDRQNDRMPRPFRSPSTCESSDGG